jgi:hypothetical protein
MIQNKNKRCQICNKKATIVISLEWVVYSLKDGNVDGSGTVTDIEKEEFYCDNHNVC